MKPRIKFDIKPVRYDWMCGARIKFYVVDKYNPDRCQLFATMLPLREFYDMQGFEDELYKNSKWVLKRLTELCVMLERWDELSDYLVDVINNEWREYPKPLAYKIESSLDGD